MLERIFPKLIKYHVNRKIKLCFSKGVKQKCLRFLMVASSEASIINQVLSYKAPFRARFLSKMQNVCFILTLLS